MGVKKKHEHENGYFDDSLLTESARSNRNPQNEWHHYKDQSTRITSAEHQVNGEANFAHSKAIGATNDNRNIYSGYGGSKHSVLSDSMAILKRNKDENTVGYDKMYERENLMGESKYGKHSSNRSSGRSHRGNHQSYQQKPAHSNNEVSTPVVVISDEEDDDEDNNSSRYHQAMASTNEYRSSAFSKSNGHHSKRASDEIVDIDDDDGPIDEEEEDDDDDVIEVENSTNGKTFV